MPRVLDASVVRDVQRKALRHGGSVRSFANAAPGLHKSQTVDWDIAGDCQRPVTIELHGRPSPAHNGKNMVYSCDGPSVFVAMEVQCRKCENCLRRRGRGWALRASAEVGQSSRTWSATLTLGPTARVLLLSRARSRLVKSAVRYEDLAGPEQFLAVEREGWLEVQKWLKRLRKNSGKSFRYLAITERHQSGDPHWHVLLHEKDTPLRYDGDLKGSWQLGFDSYKLVRDRRQAVYVTKYLSKAIEARVRASIRYGGALAPSLPPVGEVNEEG